MTPEQNEDLRILLKAIFHMVRKARPVYYGTDIIGYRVPCREFERIRAKINAIGKETPL